MCIFAGSYFYYLCFMKRNKDMKTYVRPAMRVVDLQHAQSLLQLSGGNASLRGYRTFAGTPWSDTPVSGGSPLGGWTNSGENPWK